MKADPDPNVEAPKFVELDRSFKAGGDILPAWLDRLLMSDAADRGMQLILGTIMTVLCFPVIAPVWLVGKIAEKVGGDTTGGRR